MKNKVKTQGKCVPNKSTCIKKILIKEKTNNFLSVLEQKTNIFLGHLQKVKLFLNITIFQMLKNYSQFLKFNFKRLVSQLKEEIIVSLKLSIANYFSHLMISRMAVNLYFIVLHFLIKTIFKILILSCVFFKLADLLSSQLNCYHINCLS
ncbi:hypothetical protein RFI_29105 [Reticulomyxa filosa]|uniref:Transmembrane protein n=1 Tax=Reticulomyxa filosa TaxID=46433 RepID=X6M5H7_RETFI|nr:hypothetical protein RFI_29105 [Reticulomyxa filosa]|eukprot:ETO08285.1 hypothetical protein RFI_29105 [Reticulomyxa filosa]